MKPTADELLKQIDDLASRRGSSFKILVVDDEARMREFLGDICGLSTMFEVDLAQSGQEAINLVSEKCYDLLTIDLIMPDISGLEAIEKIKESCPRLPVIIITGNATERLVKEAGVCGACKVLYKPINLNELLSEMIEMLKRQVNAA